MILSCTDRAGGAIFPPMHNNRLDLLTDYPFTRLAALLDGLDPGRAEPIALSIGEPRHAAPVDLLAPLDPANPDWAKYPPTPGIPELRAAIAGWFTRRYALPEGFVEADAHVTPTSGSREALYMAAQLAVPDAVNGKKPAVLIPNPYYQVYLGAALMAGADPVLVNADADTGFLPDFSTVPADVLDRAALAFVCAPANPQGSVASVEYWKTALDLARKHDFLLAADECYSEIHGAEDPPPAGALEAAAQSGSLSHLMVFNSLSKRSNVPGLRLGYMIADAALTKHAFRLRSHGGAPPPIPIQRAAINLLGDEAHVRDSQALYSEKFALADRLLGHHPGYRRPAGGFCLWLKVGDGEDFCRRAWTQAGVKVLPGAYLAQADTNGYNPGAAYVRIALVAPVAQVREALEGIAPLLEEI